MTDATFEPNKRYKVGKVVSKYGLATFHQELPNRWLGEGYEARSLRQLADNLNVAILREAMISAGLEPLDGEVQNTYRLLTDEDVSSGTQTAKRNELEREGIDVESVEADFVTHQAIYSYLTEVFDVSKENANDRNPLQKHSDRINRLRSRTEAVTANSIQSLTKDGSLEISKPDVSVTIQVYCQQCKSQYPVSSLLMDGSCDCAN